MPAVAFSNNDIALVAWTFDRHLDGCLGFAIYQRDVKADKETVLPAMARFASQDVNEKLTTATAPIQKFWWKDLYARRGGTYQYRIVPMGGKPGALAPLAGVEPLVSNEITLTPDRPPFKAYFNRGIVASQAVIHALGDKADINVLKAHITEPKDELRGRLMGQIFEGITSLLDRADDGGGEIHAALYELNDPKGLETRLQAADKGDPKTRNVILGNAQTVAEDGSAIEDADAENRKNLRDAGVTVIDRILAKGSIPHNKFMVLQQGGKPVAALSGSTNWTFSGLATQTNNVLVIESPRVAKLYLDYWEELKRDCEAADGNQKSLQGARFRTWNNKNNTGAIKGPIKVEDGSATVEVMFSPNTKKLLARPPKEKPVDMVRVYELIAGANQAVLFLAFDPGNNSILDAAGAALAKNPDLFVRGALTSTERAGNFRKALEQSDRQIGPMAVRLGETPSPAAARMHVAVVGEPGGPKAKGKKKGKGNGKKPERIEPDYRAIPAGSITKNDAFGAWEGELYKYGHAIIHNKIVVIDPFSDDCVVITGSHNLGYRASHNNDENMVIVRGHQGLAQAYACHVLDVYDHYAWRYWLKKYPDRFGKPLEENDTWQERYILGGDEKSPELRFWLSAATGGKVTLPSGRPAKRRGSGGTAGRGESKGKPAGSGKKRPKSGAKKRPATTRKSKAGGRKSTGRKRAAPKRAGTGTRRGTAARRPAAKKGAGAKRKPAAKRRTTTAKRKPARARR